MRKTIYTENWHKLLQEKKDADILKLISDGMDIQRKDSTGNTLLHALARAKQRINLMEALIEKNANVNARNKAGWTPLHIAVVNGSYAKAKLLVEKGADVNAEIKEHDDDTPLHLASWQDDKKMAQMLIKQGADLSANGEEGTPLETAFNLRAYGVARSIIKELRKRKELTLTQERELPKLPPKKEVQPLYSQRETDYDKEIKQQVLSGKLDVNAKDGLGNPLLNRAISKGTPDLVKFLVKRGADVNVADKQGWTPLHLAVALHSYEKAKILLDNGADIHARLQDKDTPAHMAAWYDDIPLMKLMINHKADLTDVMGEQGTPLQTAWYYRQFKMIRFLENYNYQKRMAEIKKIEDFKKRDDLEKARKIGMQRSRNRFLKETERER